MMMIIIIITIVVIPYSSTIRYDTDTTTKGGLVETTWSSTHVHYILYYIWDWESEVGKQSSAHKCTNGCGWIRACVWFKVQEDSVSEQARSSGLSCSISLATTSCMPLEPAFAARERWHSSVSWEELDSTLTAIANATLESKNHRVVVIVCGDDHHWEHHLRYPIRLPYN